MLTFYKDMKKTVVFYRTKKDECPVQEFLDSLPGKVAQKVLWVLNLLEELDTVPSSYFKKLVNTDEIWECRIQAGSNTYRILCFQENNSIVVLTHGFAKKTQKTPQSEIDRAEEYRKDYLRRKHERY